MTKSLKQLCVPRDSVFDTQRRDTVLDLTDLVEGRIEPAEFFSENYVTEGMKTLLEQSFRRLSGQSSQGVFKLKQAMGGGKTHNLLTLALLARYPDYRQQVMGGFYSPDARLGPVKVVAFSGRDTDAPFGIWGAIAGQLGKHELFKDLYAPLQAPGQKAWESLLAGETVLILLDELPPYFVSARARAIGNSDLAQVTATALSNLLVATGKEACSRVCLVLTDLVGTYESGSEQITTVLSDLEKETHRTAMTLEPVRMNSDELYHILRKRIFVDNGLPSEDDIAAVAQDYAAAIREAKQMDITNESPEQFAARIQVAYPFHPAIRDLYARFRENPGFQQTRGLIRLMRIVVSRMWSMGIAAKRALIAAHDLDFNDHETRTEIAQINNTLDNAIAHDIASDGEAVAEIMDKRLGSTDTRDACRLLFMASLANVPNAVVGLSLPELIAYLAEPGRDLSRLQTEVLAKLSTVAWYLHSTRDGKLYFRNVENLNAKLESLVKAYQKEQAVQELRKRLRDLFAPAQGWCYQQVLALPAVDEIELDQDRVTLVVAEPYIGTGLRPELQTFWDQVTYKNRVAFLTGARNTYDSLIMAGKRLRAIQQILGDLASDKVPADDPQSKEAERLSDDIQLQFLSAVRETFTILWYPFQEQLVRADLSMQFTENKYNGEQQILQVLQEKRKFETDVDSDTFRRKCERRLFTTQSLPWREIKRRAGINAHWQWHHPDALDNLKTDALRKDTWREQGGYVDKGPFPPPKTNVIVKEQFRDNDTGEVSLRLTPVNADTIYYDIGSPATTASAKLEGAELKTSELEVSFLAVDATGEHETGAPVIWRNRITLKYRLFQKGIQKCCELHAAPAATLHYTTNGSDPKIAGAVYDEPFVIPHGAPVILAYGEHAGVVSDVLRVPVSWDQDQEVQVDTRRAATWKPGKRLGYNSTRDSYAFLERAKKYHATMMEMTVSIIGEGGDKGWVELTFSKDKQVEPELIEACLDVLRQVQTTGQVQLAAGALYFTMGQDLLDWVEDVKTTLQPGEVKQ